MARPRWLVRVRGLIRLIAGLLILLRGGRVSWGNEHRRIRRFERWIIVTTSGRLGINVAAGILIGGIAYLASRATDLPRRRATAAAEVTPNFLRLPFNIRIKRVSIVFTLLRLHLISHKKAQNNRKYIREMPPARPLESHIRC